MCLASNRLAANSPPWGLQDTKASNRCRLHLSHLQVLLDSVGHQISAGGEVPSQENPMPASRLLERTKLGECRELQAASLGKLPLKKAQTVGDTSSILLTTKCFHEGDPTASKCRAVVMQQQHKRMFIYTAHFSSQI